MKSLSGNSIPILRLITLVLFLSIGQQIRAQGTIDFYIGNSDGSPFHVPYRGSVDLPVWTFGDIGLLGSISIVADSVFIADSTGGSFYPACEHSFNIEGNFPGYITISLFFGPCHWQGSPYRLADFHIIMNVHPNAIGDTMTIIFPGRCLLSDTSGLNGYMAYLHISELVIDDVQDIEETSDLPKPFHLIGAYPNPFNSSTTISFTLDELSDVRLTIFDICGREVKTISPGVFPAGERSINWNGENNGNLSVGSGLYFYRLEYDSGAALSRVTLLK
jgi:hypothetical protein